MEKTKIAITAGDPAGIGYEIACKYAINNDNYDVTIIGYKSVINDTFDNILKCDLPSDIKILEPDNIGNTNIEYGKTSAQCGLMAYNCIKVAVEHCLNNTFDAIVTCPINKKSLQLAGITHAGHTEILADLSNVDNVSMLLVGRTVKTIIATNHTSIANISNVLSEQLVYNAIENAHNAGKYFGTLTPKIAVCGLNPHAGDSGAIGTEEINLIHPAIEKANKNDIDAYGAYPADTIFLKANEWDFIISMLHDQGMVAVKMDSFGEAVNVTLNLPFIRTSVDHGTAFDIAGKGIASYTSLEKAVELADKMVKYDKSFRRV